MSIEKCRSEIDRIDSEILELFHQRMDVVSEIAKLKKATHSSVLNRKREREILHRVFNNSENKLGKYSVNLFTTLMELSRAYQREQNAPDRGMRDELDIIRANTPDKFPESAVVACMGMEGTYGQIACDRLFKVADIMYFKNFAGVCKAVADGLCEYGVLPIDNTTSGTVDGVYELMQQGNFHIVRSIDQQIASVLLAPRGVKFEDVKEIYSHPQPFKQCSEFIKGLDGVKLTVADSTATAAAMVAESGRRDVAAIASRNCRDLCDLEIISGNIQNSDYNYTRFICISRMPQIFPGANKISLIAVLSHQPGALNSVLSKFSALGLNLTKLESRPIPGRKFEYMFYFDFDASVADPGIAELLGELRNETEKFVFLGNYSEL